jgi:hypothetical protein
MEHTTLARDPGRGTFQRFSRQGAAIPVDLSLVCLWAAFGIAVTALFALGFGVNVGEVLAVAG